MSKFDLVERSYNSCLLNPNSGTCRNELLLSLTDWLISPALQKPSADAPDNEHPKVYPEGLHDIPGDPWVTVLDFTRTYPTICHPSSLGTRLTTDDNFFAWCGKRVGRRYKIQPQKAVCYLSVYGPPRLKRRAIEVLQKSGGSEG